MNNAFKNVIEKCTHNVVLVQETEAGRYEGQIYQHYLYLISFLGH